MQIRGSLSRQSIRRYLEETVVPVRLSCHTPTDSLWMLSLWFEWVDDATIRCATAADADVVRYLEHDEHVAFEVSTNDPPYSGVRGSGTATVHPDPQKERLERLLERYLGGTDSALAQRLLDPERDEVEIVIEPAVVYGWDFGHRMANTDTTAR